MADLPLLTLGLALSVNRRRGLSDAIRDLDPDVVVGAYRETVKNAPRRSLPNSPYFVGHDGRGGAAGIDSEKVRAKAMFNSGFRLGIGGVHLRVVDYEIPLRSARSDAGIGEIDLVAVEEPGNRLRIIELKVFDNMDTPLKALLQGLRYSAILQANQDQVTAEAHRSLGLTLRWPAAVAVAADTAYWEKMQDTKQATDWLAALHELAATIADRLAMEIRFLDLGDLRAEIRADGRAYLLRAPTVRTL